MKYVLLYTLFPVFSKTDAGGLKGPPVSFAFANRKLFEIVLVGQPSTVFLKLGSRMANTEVNADSTVSVVPARKRGMIEVMPW